MPMYGRYIAALAFFVAAGCSSDDPLEESKIDYTCPRLVVLADAATASVFAPGAAQTPENLVYRARFANTSAQCETDQGVIVANVALGLKFEAGPQPASGPITQQYFLVATEIDSRVLGKEVRALNVVFPPGVPEVGVEARIEGVRIPIGEGRTNRNYEIVVGFQLTADQVTYNRTNAGQ